MAAPSLTYTLTNGSTADASQVMQNFNDLLNGYTDGTKDLSINALTCAGTATLNGNINLGNASADDLNITASLASSLPIKTTNSYDIGSSTLGLRAAYFGANSQTVNIKGSASMSATWTLTLPVSAGVTKKVLYTDGSGVTSWDWGQGVTVAKSTNYTVTDTDGYGTILFTTGSGANVLTLPAVANNTNRIIAIRKVDSGTGTLAVTGASSEQIDAANTFTLYNQHECLIIQSDGSSWHILKHTPGVWKSYTPTGAWSTNSTYTGGFLRSRSYLEVWVKIALAGAPTSASLTINLPSGFTIDTNGTNSDTDSADVGVVTVKQNTGSNYFLGHVNYATTTTVTATTFTVSGTRVDRTTVSQIAPITFAASDEVHLRYRVAITQA